jgi:uncharacterized repeat protein (TIGR04076 family)
MFKVRCRLVAFEGDEKTFPCHFNYKIGDEFYYDGVHFTGRICPGLFASMMPVIHGTYLLGNRYTENIMYRYRGLDARDPSMEKYDGAGFRPLKLEALPEGTPEKAVKWLKSISKIEKRKGGGFVCSDSKILAHFTCDPIDLSNSDYAMPFYRRAMAILGKIETTPGITADEIRLTFTDFERENISPPLTPVFFQVMLEALADMNYVEIRSGKAYATGKEPPSRPKVE